MFSLETPELIIILVITLLMFGAGKLPEIASGLGKSIKSFKKAVHEMESDKENDNQKDKQ